MDNTNYDSKHTGPEIDVAIDRAKAGGEIDTLLQDKADTSSVYTKTESDTLLAGKAPAGYGLGTSAVSIDDYNNAINNGWYYGGTNYPSKINFANYGMIRVDSVGQIKFQTFYAGDTGGAMTSPLMAIRKTIDYGATWSEWEYVNPPMLLGVEYRTTERYQGKPVYVKLVDCGAMPSSERKKVDHSIPNIKNVIRCVGQRSNGDSIPSQYAASDHASIFAGKSSIYIYVGIDMSATTATAQLWYTKTTD